MPSLTRCETPTGVDDSARLAVSSRPPPGRGEWPRGQLPKASRRPRPCFLHAENCNSRLQMLFVTPTHTCKSRFLRAGNCNSRLQMLFVAPTHTCKSRLSAWEKLQLSLANVGLSHRLTRANLVCLHAGNCNSRFLDFLLFKSMLP